MKALNKMRLKIAIYAIIIILYIFGFGLIFNFRQIIGIGYYDNEKDFTTSYNGGYGGLNVKIYAHNIQNYDYNYGIEITAFSTPDSYLMGITNLDYRIRTTSVTKQMLTFNYSIPIITYSIGYTPPLRTRLYQYDNLTCKGFVDIIFKINDTPETHRISFDIGLIIEIDGGALNYGLENASTWIYVIYLTATVIPLTLLYKNIKKLKFRKWYTEEIKERDELFYKALSKNEESPSNK